ncbi:MAG: histidine kinase [Clostridia bacterium]|nr:histidine kinase [Clostridia bacterium]
MAVLNQKKKLSDKNRQIIFCTVMYALLAIFIICLFVFSFNYSAIYNSPKVKDGKADFAGVDIPSRDVACNLAGEWEFFYNKWIVTDNYDGTPDGMIKLPNVWTYKNFGSGALPKTGYASYLLLAENVQSGINVTVYRHYSNFAFRVFINGELNYRSGTLSKEVSETVVTGKTEEQHPYLTNGSTLEIVIEISAMNIGGFNAAPWIAATATGTAYGSSWRSFNFVALGITTAAVVIGILTFIFFRYKRDITMPAFMLALYAHFLTSRDMLYVFRLQTTAAMILELLTAIAAFVLLVIHCHKSGAPLNKKYVITTSVAAAVVTAMLFAFYGTPLAPVWGFLLFGVGCTYLVPIVLNRGFVDIQRYVYGTLFAFLMSIFCFELCDGLGLLVFGTEFIFTTELMIIIAFFAVLWLWKIANAARDAIRVSELECELSAVKHKALKAQIEPHFIYNSLTAIQAQYRDGLNEGDRAIEQFAKHLRLITDSSGEDIISFDDEVRNVLNYFELENLRASGKLNLYLDLNYTDFSLPVLSLQPLVENAIRHGELRDKPNGYIQLSSDKTDTDIVITVSDNGAGFDVNAAHEGVGIENTRKRFELIKATMQISSEVGKGTTVTIKIPLE